jgi:hypothetical protein
MKLLISFLFTLMYVEAINLNYFNNSFEKTLSKDQQMRIVVKKEGDEKLLIFRWTLFHNRGLVTLVNYNGEPSQQILYKRYHENSIKIDIALRQNETSRYHPYLLITFLGYNYEDKSAKFEILHKDPSGLTSIELK